ncbi:DEAD/DEAH box helicase [Rhodanobacter denitrificans]|uniref:SNF2-related protein n=1 Tax=Rhodanobacter denitrificans TaxID=666685 RepID=UPI001F1BCF61|nr:DEAD/DEAH box helicase [Rhodanobacter denitrificans]UJJ60405.1 DEAD/DEAH box helicase [Rhodanobacter denitrificans]
MADALSRRPGARVAILDNSVGTGSLLRFADPALHELGGADIHQPSVAALMAAAEAAGFELTMEALGLPEQRAKGWGVGLINPPFSIHLESPLLQGGFTTTHGKFGADTSAVSHAYALERALAACAVVVALLPTTYAANLSGSDLDDGRLRALLRLPAGSFREEGTDVDVSVAVFGDAVGDRPVILTLPSLDAELPSMALSCPNTSEVRPTLRSAAVHSSAPAITTPVTGDRRVWISHSGRKLHLRFACGFTHARVMNALLRKKLPPRLPEEGRYPRGVRFTGQGQLDLELYLAQDNPLAAWDRFLNVLCDAGARPLPDPGIVGYLRRRMRRDARARSPLGRMALVEGVALNGPLRATARKAIQCNPLRWGSGVFAQGACVEFTAEGGTYRATHPTTGEVLVLDAPAFAAAFEAEHAGGRAWTEVHPSREKVFPAVAKAIRARLATTGADRVASWSYQLGDVVELLMARGGIVGFEMALGKTRTAIALCLAGGRHNLICVEAHLVGELLTELHEVGVPAEDFQVILSADDCAALRRINIIAYSRLRMPVNKAHARRTYASLLRRRIATMVCDEAHLLRNPDSAQTRAVHAVSPRRRYGMTGTPSANLPRDLLPLIEWAGGDATAVQPYGRFHPFMEPVLLSSMLPARRGVDIFRERHVVTEWVTNEFAEDLRSGAKREVPKVEGLADLRAWVAPFIKRRVAQEPEVARYVRTPPHEVVHHVVPWDTEHLAYWLTVADEFTDWYRTARADAAHNGKQLNLVALLARIGALLMAGNYPQHGVEGFGPYGRLTSKQRYAIERAVYHVQDGHKTIVYVENPGLAELLARHINDAGVPAMPFHGKISIAERNRALGDDFRRGDIACMVATLGVVQTGLNIPEASRGIFAARSWTTKTEQQARYRMLRPQQTRHALFETLELPGSLDTYQAMMLDFKADATGAVVDFLAPQKGDEEFAHLDTIIERFVQGLSAMRGQTSHEFRQRLKHAA